MKKTATTEKENDMTWTKETNRLGMTEHVLRADDGARLATVSPRPVEAPLPWVAAVQDSRRVLGVSHSWHRTLDAAKAAAERKAGSR